MGVVARAGVAAAFAVHAAVLVVTVEARADDAPTGSRAQADYSAGRESYRSGLYGRALEEFERSLAQAPSPNTRLYIARTLRELGRWKDAAEHYRSTIRDANERGGRYVATREAAEIELGDVISRLERAENVSPVAAPAPASSPTTPESAATSPALALAPEDGARARVGATSSHQASAFTWASGGVAVVGAASFAVLYALASDRYSYLEDRCTTVRDAACESARSTGKTEETFAYVSLGVAAVAAVSAIVSVAIPSSNGATAARKETRRVWPLAF